MTTTFEEFLAVVQDHLVTHGQSPNLTPTMLNALRVGVTVVQLASANRLRRMILETEAVRSSPESAEPRVVDIENVLDLLNQELFNGYRDAGVMAPGFVVVEKTPGASTPRPPFSHEDDDVLYAVASVPRLHSMFSQEEIDALHDSSRHIASLRLGDFDGKTLLPRDSGLGAVRPDADASPSSPEPPAERSRVGSGIFFPARHVRRMLECDCAERPNGCSACQDRHEGCIGYEQVNKDGSK